MVFNSFIFLFVFAPIVIGVYHLLSHRAQNAWLLCASLVFYAAWDWRFLFPLLCTTSIDYLVAHRIQAIGHSAETERRRRRLLIVSICSNLGLLGYFKYFDFFAGSLSTLARTLGFELGAPALGLVLPLAISFYTFQALSYTIDVYRGHFRAKESFADFFLAVLYFPHLIAGPIQRAASLIPQIVNPRSVSIQQLLDGTHLVIWGLFKKVFIADNVSGVADRMFALDDPSGAQALVGVLAFSIQIYADFSGYTDIARGLAKLMGFEFQLNFNLPYFATNPSDFWRRWHISLSEWLRDYLYKPLGGNRGGSSSTYRNLAITMVLGGLWHGAAWNFVLWGAYHGAILAIHRASEAPLRSIGERMARFPRTWWSVRVACMFSMTLYGWMLFRATSLEQIGAITAALLGGFDGMTALAPELTKIGLHALPLLAAQMIQLKTGELMFMRPRFAGVTLRTVVYSTLIYLMAFRGGKSDAFIYFQF